VDIHNRSIGKTTNSGHIYPERANVKWSKRTSGKQIRLFLGTWENPHPKKRVIVIDYVKVGDTTAAPFCVAMTLEE
jgi:hypothetical protein